MPQGAYDNSMDIDGSLQNALHMNTLFLQSQPLFNNDLFQIMQSMEDPSVWRNMNSAGLNWMGGALQCLDPEMTMDTMRSGFLNVDNRPSGNTR